MSSRATLLATLTDEALTSLASTGLLRRARKDLEKHPPHLTEESDGRFIADCEDGVARVTVPMEGSRGARCTCPARERCRHVLAACLAIREHLEEEAGRDTAGHEADPVPPHMDAPAPVLEPTAPPPARAASTKVAGAPRTRDEVLAAIRAALADMVALGFSRLSATTRDRLVTLAMSAHGVDLALLEKQLRALADAVSRALAREVTFHPRDLLGAASRTWVIAAALAAHAEPRPEALVGQFRTRYDDVPGVLGLHGMGAWQWRTPSGFAGLTLAFWDEARQHWTTWSDSRPEFYTAGGFDPQQSYVQASVWEAESPLHICRRHVRLSGARRNPVGRLSSTGVRVATGSATDPDQVRMERLRFDDWRHLAEWLKEVQVPRIQEPGPVEHLVVVTPAAWGRAEWSDTRQETSLPLLDAGRRAIVLSVPYVEAWSFAVRTLEAWQPEEFGTWGVLGFARIDARGLVMEPVSFYNAACLPQPFDSPIMNLTLDVPVAHPRRSPRTRDRGERGELQCSFGLDALREAARRAGPGPRGAMERLPATAAPHASGGSTARSARTLESLLEGALSVLESMAEAGTTSVRTWQAQRLAEISRRLSASGMDTCGKALRDASLPSGTHHGAPEDPAGRILRAWWLVRAASQQAEVARAAAVIDRVTWPGGQG